MVALAWQAVLQAVLGEGTGESAVRSERKGKGNNQETTSQPLAESSLLPGMEPGQGRGEPVTPVPSAPTRAKGEEKAAETRGHREEPTGRNSAQQSQVLLLLSSTGGTAQSQRAQDTRDPKPRMFTKQEHKEQHNAG